MTPDRRKDEETREWVEETEKFIQPIRKFRVHGKIHYDCDKCGTRLNSYHKYDDWCFPCLHSLWLKYIDYLESKRSREQNILEFKLEQRIRWMWISNGV